MFNETWRKHWGLLEDPFACEDADKDHVLDAVDTAAVHSGFDRVFGNPRVPAPAIVFGEKGSGKSGLRRMMERRIAAHNEAMPNARAFTTEYIDFDRYLEHVRLSLRASRDGSDAGAQVTDAWTITDHLDAILSLGVTELVDQGLDAKSGEPGAIDRKALSHKQGVELRILTSVYYRSQNRTVDEAVDGIGRLLHLPRGRQRALFALCVLMTLVGVAIALLPLVGPWELGRPTWWLVAGAAVAAGAWIWRAVDKSFVRRRAHAASRAVRVLPREPGPVARALGMLRPKERAEYALPVGPDDASRYELIRRFVGILESQGYAGWYVLMDRVDEPSTLSSNETHMRRFVESILDIKLLQYPGLALKLFLPIELESIYRSASADSLKRMRLDKSNLIPELKWTGVELYEIANERLKACLAPDPKALELADLFAENFDRQHLRDTLTVLGTPRYAFGFLSAVFLEYVRDLPATMPDDDPRWRLPREPFDVVRGLWLDRTGLLRRSLN